MLKEFIEENSWSDVLNIKVVEVWVVQAAKKLSALTVINIVSLLMNVWFRRSKFVPLALDAGVRNFNGLRDS